MYTGSCIPQSSNMHAAAAAAASMHAGSYMPVHRVHACRFIRSCQLLLMHACARRAYCNKCRVNLGSKSVGRPNVPVLISDLQGLHVVSAI
jgi:hypothetical protein